MTFSLPNIEWPRPVIFQSCLSGPPKTICCFWASKKTWNSFSSWPNVLHLKRSQHTIRIKATCSMIVIISMLHFVAYLFCLSDVWPHMVIMDRLQENKTVCFRHCKKITPGAMEDSFRLKRVKLKCTCFYRVTVRVRGLEKWKSFRTEWRL